MDERHVLSRSIRGNFEKMIKSGRYKASRFVEINQNINHLHGLLRKSVRNVEENVNPYNLSFDVNCTILISCGHHERY